MNLGWRAAGISCFLSLILSACAPGIVAPGPATTAPHLSVSMFVAADGAELPLRTWQPEDREPKAVILALHGFNDYANFFDDPGDFLARRGIASYAYDQRGFGAAPAPGRCAGTPAYAGDAADAARAVKRRHPGIPLYIHGTSMGGAIAMLALTGDNPPPVDGVILAAPAVWGRATMPWYQRLSLWIGAHTLPWLTVTGQGLGIVPSDNYEMLVRLGRDPKIIKETRIGTIYGLVNLMDAALESAAKLTTPALILYGEKDEIIPKVPTRMMLERLPETARSHQRIALYQAGYHMLLRDLQASAVWKDMARWVIDPKAPLPSKADRRDLAILGLKKEAETK